MTSQRPTASSSLSLLPPQSLCLTNITHHHPSSPVVAMAFVASGNEYDFIVVGGGTAGNAVAGRLAENPRVRVLVIEAGIPNPNQISAITTPSQAFNLRGSQYDWAYKTTMIKRDDYERVEKPNTRGKTLGGSSCANYFTWIPGSKATFDDWEQFGGSEWNWDNCVEYLRKCATY